MRAGAIIFLGITAAYFIGKALNKASSNIPDWASIIEAEEAAALAEYHQFAVTSPFVTSNTDPAARDVCGGVGSFFHGHLCTCCEGDGWRTAFPVVPPFHEAGYDD